MHEGLPSCLAKVLAGKRLLVWKRLLERYEYDDMAVFEFMTRGVPLVGIHDAPPVFLSRLNLLASPRRTWRYQLSGGEKPSSRRSRLGAIQLTWSIWKRPLQMSLAWVSWKGLSALSKRFPTILATATGWWYDVLFWCREPS